MLDSLHKKLIHAAGFLFFSKIVSILASILTTAALARELNSEEFGVWSILVSVSLMMSFLELGLSMSLRNKLSRLIASGAEQAVLRDQFLSVFYVYLFFAISLITVLVVIASESHFLSVFNSDAENSALLYVIIIGTLNLPLSLSGYAFYSYFETYKNAQGEIAWNFMRTAFVLGILALGDKHFLTIVLAFYLPVIMVGLLQLNRFMKSRGWRWRLPAFRKDLINAKELIADSLAFSIIQVATISIANTDTILVAKVSSASQSGDFSVVQKIYLLFVSFYMISMQSYVSAYTLKYETKEFAWVAKTLKRGLTAIVLAVIVFGFAVVNYGEVIVRMWTGKMVSDKALYIVLLFWSVVTITVNHFSIYLNGIGKVKRQTIIISVCAIANIPLSLFFGYRLGAAGVVFASILVMIPQLANNVFETMETLKVK